MHIRNGEIGKLHPKTIARLLHPLSVRRGKNLQAPASYGGCRTIGIGIVLNHPIYFRGSKKTNIWSRGTLRKQLGTTCHQKEQGIDKTAHKLLVWTQI